nr:hypothetical protein [Tanacetum cinerariifolium]
MDLLNTLLETCTALTRKVENLEQDKVAQALEITKLKQRVKKLERKNKLKVSGLRRLKKMQMRMSPWRKLLLKLILLWMLKLIRMQMFRGEPAELKEVIKVVTTAKLMTEVVTAAAPITVDTIIAVSSAARRRKGTEAQAKKNMMVYLKNMVGFKMNVFKGMSYNDIRPIFEKYFNSNVAFLEKSEKELEEEASRALKRKSESSKEKAAKNKSQKLEIVRFMWSSHHNLYNHSDDLVSREKMSIDKDYYCWSKTYCCWYKLMLLDNAVDTRLRLLEQSAVVDDKMRKYH